MFPPSPVAGYIISGFVPWRHLKDAIYPPNLYETLNSMPQFNRKELAMDLDMEKKCIQGLPPEQYEDWIACHIRRERQWMDILRYLMVTDPTDLTAIVFDGVDKIQHLCWRLIDPTLSLQRRTAWERNVYDLCLTYFRLLDNYIAEIVTLAGPEAHIFIASDHGFGPSTEIFYINVWLERHGYLHWADKAEHDTRESLTVDRLKNHIALIDWSRTKAYAVTPSSNGIFIRVAKEPNQTGVAPEEYDSFRRHLMEELATFINPITGQPVVTRIQTREEAYPGSLMHLAPDLLLTLEDGGFVSILNADEPLKMRSEITGTHRPNGIFMASGPGIRKGAHTPMLSILDVAPLLLHSMELPIPQDLEGRLPSEIYEASFLLAHPIRFDESNRTSERPLPNAFIEAEIDADAEAAIIEQLRALHYLE
jgi:predicted AlkP superfamily phosphohydrolase/phosphomutase